jgi:hypothetical protein
MDKYALVGCEESQEVCKALRKVGVIAFSCDLQDCSGNKPDWHIKGDVLNYLGKNKYNNFQGWDLGIFHPTCTRLCNSGVMWLEKRNLWLDLGKAVQFFNDLQEAPIDKICIENPIPHKYAVKGIGKYTQLIQPWMFGHGETKATCLWLKGLPKLKPTNIVEGREQRLHRLPPSKDRAKLRSKTYPGIAKAMAEQWGKDVFKCPPPNKENEKTEDGNSKR